MTRWLLAGCMALGAVAVLDVGSPTAEAAPTASPFAGTYVEGASTTLITISNGGHISSSYSSPDSRQKVTRSGAVSDDGRYSYTLSVTTSRYDERRDRTWWHTSRYELAGNMELDAAGNIVSTPDAGESFVWVRQ